MKKLLVVALAALVGLASLSGTVRSQGPTPLHMGSNVVFVRYEGELAGERRAAILTTNTFECPADGPHVGETCANVAFLIAASGEAENMDPVRCGEGETCMVNPIGLAVASGWERRANVLYDPTGKTERSFHVYGQAEGEDAR